MPRNLLRIAAILVACHMTSVGNTWADDSPLFPNVGQAEIECKLGPQRTVIADGAHGLHYFPDGPISVLGKRPLRFLMPAANGTILATGRDFADAVPQAKVLGPSGAGPDAHYAGIYSIWQEGDGDRYFGIYHAENHDGMGKMSGNAINGAYWSICLATIDVGTGRVERRGEILKADRPKREVTGKPHEVAALRVQGLGEPCATKDREGANVLCYYTETSNRLDRSVCVCVARSPVRDGGAPGSWKKYHNGGWGEDGMGGHDTPVMVAQGGDVGQSFVTFVPAWDRYVMVFCHQAFGEYISGTPSRSGLYVATSGDGLRWSEPQKIMTKLTVFKNGKECVQHPTLLVSGVTKDTLTGQLLYAYTPRWPTPHHLVSRPVTIHLKGL